jgi:hypothetical protein
VNDARGKPLEPPQDVAEARQRLWWAIDNRDHGGDIAGALDDLVEAAKAESFNKGLQRLRGAVGAINFDQSPKHNDK